MYLVFDIGGTNLRAGYSTDGQTLASIKSVPTPQDYQAGLKTLLELGQELSAGQVEQAAIGIAGTVDQDQLVQLPHLTGWVNQPLAADFLATFGVKPIIRNDAEMAGLGEAEFGTGKNYSSFLYFTIGTGVGGALIKREETLSATNLEPGHQIIDPGNQTELEQLILGGGLKTTYTAMGLAHILKTHPVEAIILGGGLILNNRIPLGEIKQELAIKLDGPSPVLLKAALGDEAGLYGALSLLK